MSTFESAKTAESKFRYLAESRGWSVTTPQPSSGTKEHWDFEIKKPSLLPHYVDVKSRKKINRSDLEPQDQWHWIELHGVNQDDLGWLMGKSDWIAFETRDKFIIVNREKILSLVGEKVDLNSRVTDPSDAYYKVYSRIGRYDALTLVETSELEQIADEIWPI